LKFNTFTFNTAWEVGFQCIFSENLSLFEQEF